MMYPFIQLDDNTEMVHSARFLGRYSLLLLNDNADKTALADRLELRPNRRIEWTN